MMYSLTFIAMSVSFAFLALTLWNSIGWPAAVICYIAFSFVILAIAYAGPGTALLLKRNSGRHSFIAWIMLGPYFVLSAVLFEIYKRTSKEVAFRQVVPNLSFGRRLSNRESVETNFVSILDLAGEFAEARSFRQRAGYHSLPMLDGIAPSEQQLQSAVEWIRTTMESGPVYVHCALGHGRSVCVVIAYLLSIGEVNTVTDGIRRLRALRPGVRLNSQQRRCLETFVTIRH